MGKRSASAGIVAVVSLSLIVGSAVSASAGGNEEQQFINLITAERRDAGVRALSIVSDLTQIARRHSQEMADGGGLGHSDDLERQVQGCWTEIGENVGTGWAAGNIHEAFMNSSGHRANILGRTYNQAGIGVAFADNGSMWVTEIFATRECARKAPKRSTPAVKAPARTPVKTAVRTVTASRPTPATRSISTASQPVTPAPEPAVEADPATAERSVDLLARMVDLDLVSS